MRTWKEEYKTHRKQLYRNILDVSKQTVLHGPFKGMRMPAKTSWGGGSVGPKVLGTYEMELHDAFARALSLKPVAIIDVGCAEGFYAVGLARIASDAQVIAYDISPAAQQVCKQMAAENGVAERVDVRGACLHEDLERDTAQGLTFVLCDCEGYELELLDPRKVPSLKNAILLVEVHEGELRYDSLMRHFSQTLSATHHVEFIKQGARNPHDIPELAAMPEIDRYMLVSEYRGVPMYWLYATPRSLDDGAHP